MFFFRIYLSQLDLFVFGLWFDISSSTNSNKSVQDHNDIVNGGGGEGTSWLFMRGIGKLDATRTSLIRFS